jgi:hypothetical protein
MRSAGIREKFATIAGLFEADLQIHIFHCRNWELFVEGADFQEQAAFNAEVTIPKETPLQVNGDSWSKRVCGVGAMVRPSSQPVPADAAGASKFPECSVFEKERDTVVV